jgi:hypothetical protein
MNDQTQPETKPAIDYTPPIPEQLKRQLAEADQIRADMKPAAPEGAAEAAPPVSESQGSEGQPPQPEGLAPSTLSPAEDDGQSWEQRFRSQAGRLEQERKTNLALADRLQALEKQLTLMKVRGAEEQRSDAAVPKVKPKLITEQEAEEYGEEFLNVVAKRAKEEYAPEFDELAERLKRLEGRVEGVGTVIEKTQQQDIYQSLASAVPEWRQINKSDQFKLWLQQPDSYSGRRRHDLLTEAFSRHEANRVVTFFRGFLTEAAGLPRNPQAQAPSAPPLPGNGNGSGKPSLEDFTAPGRARSAPQPLPPDKPIYSHAWIAKFMADKRTGKYRGREADADAIERDIYQAQHEGRIQ